MANALFSAKTVEPLAADTVIQPVELVKVKYIGDFSKGARMVYGVALTQGGEYEFPLPIAELCAREESLFQVVDDSPVATKLKESVKKAIGKA